MLEAYAYGSRKPYEEETCSIVAIARFGKYHASVPSNSRSTATTKGKTVFLHENRLVRSVVESFCDSGRLEGPLDYIFLVQKASSGVPSRVAKNSSTSYPKNTGNWKLYSNLAE